MIVSRVAYLSPDFRNHATSHLLSRRIELHDPRQFRIVGMSFGPKANDAMRRRISGAFDAFFDVSAVSDLTAAMLQAEGVDIAVDLAGHTEYARHPDQKTGGGASQLSRLSRYGRPLYRLSDCPSAHHSGSGSE